MEGLVNVLKDLQGVIQRGLSNFKKSPKERLTVDYVETRQELLEKDWALFKENNTKIHELYSTKDVQKLNDLYDSTEDIYITYKCLLKSTLSKVRPIEKAVTDTSTSSNSASKPNALAKLPKISIPTFTGKYTEWTTFRDLFVSMVHNNKNLDNVQKMHYLKSHLSGEAEQLVRHTPVSDANYMDCWLQIERRYSNRKYLVDCILTRLFSQKRMQCESASSIKELLDTTKSCLSALKNLNVDVTTWDVMIIHIVSFKLNSDIRKQWELRMSNPDSDELPTFKEFTIFLERQFRALESIEPKRNYQGNSSHAPKAMVAVSNSGIRCEYCSETHKLCFCKAFSKQPVETRREFVAKHQICFNCLGSNHTVTNCKKQTSCKVCHKRHHSMLHLSDPSVNKSQDTTPVVATDNSIPSTSVDSVVSCLSINEVTVPGQVLLATALVKIESKTGEFQLARALLDQGSQACFITEGTVQFLRLNKIPIHGTISGLGHRTSIARYMVNLTIQSRIDPNYKLNVSAYVLSKITSYLPERSVNNCTFDWLSIDKSHLADPSFSEPNKIDILLGADAYSCIIKSGILKSPSGTLIAQNTALGWILSGAIRPISKEHTLDNISVMHVQLSEEDILKRFWEIEENIETIKIFTPEETRCEELYSASTRRDKDGRYIVRLPFRDENPPCKAGNSRAIAETRFKALERRLIKNKNLKEQYAQVINEYLQLGHMRLVNKNDNKKEEAVYMPHHAVIRNDKTTTKLRVVFNASEKNSNGVSLNDTLLIGPTLQADLRHTVLRWRVHPIGLVADIIKMYRQIRMADEDTMFQRILWREDPEKDINDYELLTVTFGTASAPYQAVRTLHQIVYDEGENYPMAADRVLTSFYMDDLMTGCNSVEEGLEIYKQITELLNKGGFSLQKWNSNHQILLNEISSLKNTDKGQCKSLTDENKERNLEDNNYRTNDKKDKEYKGDKEDKEGKDIDIKLDSTMKILGLTWNRSADSFQYSVNLPTLTAAPVTKRAVISDIARLFDPLGWLAPSVVLAKILIQKLWLAGVGWDDPLPTVLLTEWSTYREELSQLTKIQIPRWLGTRPNDDLELHGFCDASKAAYAAVVYLRIIDAERKVTVTLLVAKTRVAPIKQISIPRLELCGAVLLSKLLTETADVLNIPRDRISAWTDSTIVLAWLNSHPSKWKTFVANRTSEILTSITPSQWFHVSTKENPADCASRGVQPGLLREHTIWFHGPQFLKDQIIIYKKPKDLDVSLEQCIKAHVTTLPDNDEIFKRFSSLQRLLRVIAYCRRFINKNKGYLHKKEIDQALECCIRTTQRNAFNVEYKQLQNRDQIQLKNSKLKSLNPYLDDKSIMRVYGRLEKAPLDEQTKHPIVLPNNAHFTQLLVLDAHSKTMHGGPQLMINYLRSCCWIIRLRNMVKQCVRRCVICVRQSAKVKGQMMGTLPSVRCSPARPFLHSGVDYAGPISVRTTKGRGHHSYKGYICLFVCMSTRAIHLEVVSDMSTQAFLAAFRRFVSRRGHCAKLWSDNGTTFVGASRELQQLARSQASIAEHLEGSGTEWHFIPPHAPNFGGLWEAGVKSTKFHLKRVIGESTLTYEELSTLLAQVEACLNSRPMSVIDLDDPGEPISLTPGHFLIGEPLVNVPDYNLESTNVNSLTRWQFVQRMLQSFWRRWSHEYLVHLMNRYKWSSKVPEPNIGDIVLIKEDDLPPSRWLLGRVLEKHPGNDNVTRVVTLRTKSNTIKRPTNKLCVLPIAKE